MSETTARHKLPYIMPLQAQSHVLHNEALRRLDALVHISVVSRAATAPPAAPGEGEAHLVAAAGAGGAFAGHGGELAVFEDGAWVFLAPAPGWIVHVRDEAIVLVRMQEGWTQMVLGGTVLADRLGVNAAPDDTNRLAVMSDVALFSHAAETGGSGAMRLILNKKVAADTGSLLFQTGWSGRAEMGLAGNDDWHLKVSADGVAWTEALVVDGATGRVGIGTGIPSTRLDVAGAIRVGGYMAAALPDAATAGAGAIAYVQDAASGPVPAFSDGTAWHALCRTGFERIHVRASPSADQTLTSDIDRLAFGTVHANEGAGWDAPANRFVAPRAAIYQFNVSVRFDQLPPGGYTRLLLMRNGSTEGFMLGHAVIGAGASGDFHTLTVCSALDLSAGDEVTVNGGHANGGGRAHVESALSIWSAS